MGFNSIIYYEKCIVNVIVYVNKYNIINNISDLQKPKLRIVIVLSFKSAYYFFKIGNTDIGVIIWKKTACRWG